jgi:hypothetical protein
MPELAILLASNFVFESSSTGSAERRSLIDGCRRQIFTNN